MMSRAHERDRALDRAMLQTIDGSPWLTANWMTGHASHVLRGPTRSYAHAWDGRGNYLHSVENHLADGRVDYSRSHYSRNGRKVKGRVWRRLFKGKP
jgi:hypothetical protein